MPNTKLATGYGSCFMENPRNYTYNHMTAVENFHLVKRVMSVKPSIRNQQPGPAKHLGNSNVHRAPSASLKLRIPNQSSQSQFKRLEQHKENQVLLHKMLKIMERPLVTKTTSFQHMQRVCTTNFGRNFDDRSPHNRSVQSEDSKGRHRRPGSASSEKAKNTPTAGMGPISLNLSQRKKEMSQISQENYRMVNSLVQVKPRVPLATALDKWSYAQDKRKRNLSCVRYGTPKPLQGLKLRLSVGNLQGERRNSNASQMSNRSQHQRSQQSLQRDVHANKPLHQHTMNRRQVVNLVPRELLAHKPPIQKRQNQTHDAKFFKNSHPKTNNFRTAYNDQADANSQYAKDQARGMSRGSRRQRAFNAYDISAQPQHLDSATKFASSNEGTGTEGITLPPMSTAGGENSNPDINAHPGIGAGLQQNYNGNNLPNRRSSQLTRKRKTVQGGYPNSSKFLNQPYAVQKNNQYRQTRPVTTQNTKGFAANSGPTAQMMADRDYMMQTKLNKNKINDGSTKNGQSSHVFQGIVEKTIEDDSMQLPADQYAAASRRQTRTAEGGRRRPQNMAMADTSNTASMVDQKSTAPVIVGNAQSQLNVQKPISTGNYQIVGADTNSDEIIGGANMFEAPHNIDQQLVSNSSANIGGGANTKSFQQIGSSVQRQSNEKLMAVDPDIEQQQPKPEAAANSGRELPYEEMLPQEYPRLLE